ncbi:CFI-box-CTERM domain-containing protein [Butyrivibrio sp.]|uniref:CFI-box-CTERM domain-containing protein n=1 Tax=Butyrivibrio sp. TaxID=28121 RepID=UPI0025B8E0D2|nr:CFI-box-CTERM domain-containing protein [Butyrivibrio sp.]MBE5838446.1 hypothetical protein [Butyrivibrio sp.]
MGDWVRDNTCGTCTHYEYAGENEKGYCSYYKSYYFSDDTCSHYEKSDSYSSGSSGCFLTTACCEYKGLPDDCHELETMRKLRDQYILKQPYGNEIVQGYYEEAPFIVEKIKNSEDSAIILESIYKSVLKIVELVEMGKNDEAIISYMLMLHKLSKI